MYFLHQEKNQNAGIKSLRLAIAAGTGGKGAAILDQRPSHGNGTKEQYNSGDSTTSAIYGEPTEARGKGEKRASRKPRL